jgi:putative copper resistance protein D
MGTWSRVRFLSSSQPTRASNAADRRTSFVILEAWDAAAIAVKATLYGATLAAAGGVFFLTYSDSLLEAAERASMGRRVGILIAVALAASAARILATAASMSGEASGMLDTGVLALVWHGGEGRAAMIRAVGLLLAVPALAADRRPGVWAIAGAAGAATSFAWVGHVHAAGLRWATLLLGIHLLAIAFWVGALWPLWLLARGDEALRAAAPAARFGRAAVGTVSLLLLAGVGLLAVLLGSASELWRSDYGRTVCGKLALVACLLALAAFNKLRLTPRLAAGQRAAARALHRSIAAEMAIAGAVFLVTAALTTLSGPAGGASRFDHAPWSTSRVACAVS